MSLNDKNIISQSARAVDVYPGVANATSAADVDPVSANFVNDPTTPDKRAGAGPNFDGHLQAGRTLKETAGVVEARPGIIETSNIDPLNENSNKDDGWANATARPAGSTTGAATNLASSAAQVAAGAAKLAYGHAVGDEAAKKAGKEAVHGK